MIYVLWTIAVICLMVVAVLFWIMIEACSQQDWIRRVIIYSCVIVGIAIGVALVVGFILPHMHTADTRAKASLAAVPAFLMLWVGNTIANFFRD